MANPNRKREVRAAKRAKKRGGEPAYPPLPPSPSIITIPSLQTPDHCMPGSCYLNVHAHVRLNGGRPRFGWTRTEIVGNLVATWIHHCVWEAPGGQLYELTPYVRITQDGWTYGELRNEVKFWPDGEAQLSILPGNMLRSLPPKIVRLRNCPEAFSLQTAIEQGDAATFAGDHALAETHYKKASAIANCQVDWPGGCTPFPASALHGESQDITNDEGYFVIYNLTGS